MQVIVYNAGCNTIAFKDILGNAYVLSPIICDKRYVVQADKGDDRYAGNHGDKTKATFAVVMVKIFASMCTELEFCLPPLVS